MAIRLRCQLAAGFMAITIASSVGMGQQVNGAVAVPPVPTNIEVPEGNTAFLKGHALGTQNYMCLPSATSATGFAFTFFAPQATLFQTILWFQGDLQQQIITHFLSPNPHEGGKPRATWQGSFDTSAVWGSTVQASTDEKFVAKGAIAWLKLEQVGRQRGPTGGGLLADTTFIQRLNTSGGVAPAEGCSQASDVGKPAIVPYTADYFFYKAVKK